MVRATEKWLHLQHGVPTNLLNFQTIPEVGALSQNHVDVREHAIAMMRSSQHVSEVAQTLDAVVHKQHLKALSLKLICRPHQHPNV